MIVFIKKIKLVLALVIIFTQTLFCGPLHDAVEKNDIEGVQTLLADSKTNINEKMQKLIPLFILQHKKVF